MLRSPRPARQREPQQVRPVPIQQQEHRFDEMVIEIARKKGLIYDIDVLNSNSYKAIADLIFAPFDEIRYYQKISWKTHIFYNI